MLSDMKRLEFDDPFLVMSSICVLNVFPADKEERESGIW